MNRSSHTGWRVAVAAIAAGAIAALGAALPASAAPLVDPDQPGSLTIHKYEQPGGPTGLPNNGTEQPVTGLTPLEGVGFTVYKVDPIDLTTNAGWLAASDLSQVFDGTEASITGAGYTATAVGAELLTDANGEISLTGLDLGLYYVVETSPLAGATAVAPFLVTVPLTDPDNLDGWLYDVHVYPKNSIVSADKTVEDSEDIKLGDEIEFTITTEIPDVPVIDAYRIVDPLDEKLDYVSTAVTLLDGTPLDPADYVVSFDAATNTVTVDFTASGLAVLAANSTTQVQTVITTTVNTVGEIANTALLYPNQHAIDEELPTPTPTVETKWGEITFEKIDGTGNPLTGAVFSVYPTEADALAGTNAIVLGGETEFTVGPDGQVTISSLRYSDFADGVTVAPGEDGYQTYWLVETVAPDGYELLAQPIEFTVTAATTTIGIDQEIVNVPSNGGFELPLTGGTGTMLFALGGGMLLAGAVFFALYARRKDRAEA
ncbi:SpaH/EbpB family LPXTG-anchored major pilin [Agromyces sp. H66]|uniref:SpaH/EbpB family LPXTG-anchored major pilin n=1 Tax=Agromyces sp. H66 TaxID=2529859 RepID=UPI0010AA19DE|nr:SpaH/EbpB family LPXTG-anchored major pilin [Agromyces sp. H66]